MKLGQKVRVKAVLKMVNGDLARSLNEYKGYYAGKRQIFTGKEMGRICCLVAVDEFTIVNALPEDVEEIEGGV
jgi:hypothetical protein